MDIDFKSKPNAAAVAYIVTKAEAPEDVDAQVGAVLERAMAASPRFEGKPGQMVEAPGDEGGDVRRLLAVGVGEDPGVRVWEKAGAAIVKKLLASGLDGVDVAGAPDADAAARLALGAKLAAYRFDAYRTKLKDEKKPSIGQFGVVLEDLPAAETAYAPLAAAADGTATARDLVSEPPNILHPESFADRIAGLADLGLEITTLDEPAMEKLGMGSLLGVGQGSVRGSRLCVMAWRGGADAEAAPVALVGKGVTFDTGGISLKPGGGMEDMKGDMGGSAAVVGAMVALAKRKAKANVVGLVGLVENMPDGNAQRPGDIVTSADGQTIEIQNTDAEGRLVLADVLWYAQETYKPAAIIDLATLTGAVVVALGHEYAGVFSNNDDLAEQLTSAGEAEGEPVWRLPLSAGYDKLIDSQFADMKNVGGRSAGSITAAQFLKRFIQDDTPWAHIDIAGTAWRPGDQGGLEPAWASGYGPRLLDRFIKDNYED